MAIKDVLAVVDTGDRDEQFLRDALGFAEFHNASLSLVILSALPSADYALTIARPYAFLQDYTEAVEAKQQRIAALAGSTNVEVRTISDQPSVIFVKTAVYARYADVILFGPANSYDHPPIRRETAESILFSSGRPVLIVPGGYKARAIEHLAIGWNATRESTHALRDATAFASPRAKIDILVLDAKPTVNGHGSEPGADIARHLARHGFVSTVVPVRGGDEADGDALVTAARNGGATVLALGAYGHSRLREMILGGVTRDLLGGAPLPLLFSH
ncbi:universal stress protein [Sphingobium sp. Ndbn-10]|uniref:universal stress protein n=1 Tax=Sphingobium sp. Ndbn-10 TaxID=1667223 RepID=UPI0008189490|nr:universal stress protein [Sphingobium sp. Ndbn-10]